MCPLTQTLVAACTATLYSACCPGSTLAASPTFFLILSFATVLLDSSDHWSETSLTDGALSVVGIFLSCNPICPTLHVFLPVAPQLPFLSVQWDLFCASVTTPHQHLCPLPFSIPVAEPLSGSLLSLHLGE